MAKIELGADRTLTAKNLNRRYGKIEFIVLHDTAGNGGVGDAKYLANDPENRGVSVDFCIVKDGTIYQLNPDLKTRCTSHAGRRTRYRNRVNGAVNTHSVGIEIAQKSVLPKTNAYPAVQVDAVAKTCAWLCMTLGLTKTDITTHKDIITDGSRSDPRAFPWSDFWVKFNEYIGKWSINESEAAVGLKTIHTVVVGDTLSGLARKYNTSIERLKALNGMNTPSTVIKVGQVLIVQE